jgi:diguanylate cyclase (GGDEF)-like protein
MVVILPETGLEKAYNLFARRIKKAMEEGIRTLSPDRAPAGVTIGIASYPRDGATAREVVLAADRALLEAKKHKHQCVIGCSRPVAACVTP